MDSISKDTKIYCGSPSPDDNMGVEGDLYIEHNTGLILKKAHSKWELNGLCKIEDLNINIHYLDVGKPKHRLFHLLFPSNGDLYTDLETEMIYYYHSDQWYKLIPLDQDHGDQSTYNYDVKLVVVNNDESKSHRIKLKSNNICEKHFKECGYIEVPFFGPNSVMDLYESIPFTIKMKIETMPIVEVEYEVINQNGEVVEKLKTSKNIYIEREFYQYVDLVGILDKKSDSDKNISYLSIKPKDVQFYFEECNPFIVSCSNIFENGDIELEFSLNQNFKQEVCGQMVIPTQKDCKVEIVSVVWYLPRFSYTILQSRNRIYGLNQNGADLSKSSIYSIFLLPFDLSSSSNRNYIGKYTLDIENDSNGHFPPIKISNDELYYEESKICLNEKLS